MRILAVTPIGYSSDRSGGAEAYVFELVKRIASKTNIEITVLTSGGNFEHTESQERRLRIESISQGLFTFPLFLIFLIKQRVGDADIVVENISKFPLMIPAIVSRISKRPFITIVHHVHGKTLFMELPFVIALLLLLYEYISLFIYALLRVPVITVSRASETELRRLGFRNIYIVHPGLPWQVENDNSNSYKSKKPLLVYISRVKRYKRLDHFVITCKHVIEEIPEAICLMVGKGDKRLEAKLKELASRLGINDHVKVFVGNISNSLRRKILRKAWLSVFTSAKEGFGISVIETLSHGVPVVAYDIPAMREICAGRSLCILAKDGNIGDLATQCIKILKISSALSNMSSEAGKLVRIYNYDATSVMFLKAMLSSLRARTRNQSQLQERST